MLTPKEKLKVIEKVQIHDKDTGSAEAQIALFTEEIEQLAKHLKKHGKDNSSRLGLLCMLFLLFIEVQFLHYRSVSFGSFSFEVVQKPLSF